MFWPLADAAADNVPVVPGDPALRDAAGGRESRLPQPLAEVFGLPPTADVARATARRAAGQCPFQAPGMACVKNGRRDPLGVCSVQDQSIGLPVIVCAHRFTHTAVTGWVAEALFGPDAAYTAVSEVPVQNEAGESLGNIDHVVTQVDARGRVHAYASLEIQGVYCRGNVRDAFVAYHQDPGGFLAAGWRPPSVDYPRPDYVSSCRKRLVPQIRAKGLALHRLGVRQAVVVHESLFTTVAAKIPRRTDAAAVADAELVWVVCGLEPRRDADGTILDYVLTRREVVYTDFLPCLAALEEPGDIDTDALHRVIQARRDAVARKTYALGATQLEMAWHADPSGTALLDTTPVGAREGEAVVGPLGTARGHALETTAPGVGPRSDSAR